MRSLYFCGAGNSEGVRLAQVINRHRRRWDRMVLLDDDPKTLGRKLLGVEVIGSFDRLAEASPERDEVVNLVARTTRGRGSARARIESFGIPFATLVDPAVDLDGVELATDVVVYQNAILGPEVSVDDGSVVFMGAIVGHESHVGRCCVVAANAVLNARVRLEDGVYVGTNATVIPEVTVGTGATIGAGSVVIQDVPPGASVIGVPGQILAGSAPESSAGAGAPTSPRPAAVDAAPPAAASTIERFVAEVWCEVLHLPRVDPNQNFFDLGGNSLLAMQLRERLESRTGLALPLSDLFRFPSVRALSAHLSSRGAGPRSSPGSRRAAIRKAAVLRRARAIWDDEKEVPTVRSAG